MRVRIILGYVEFSACKHAIAELTNGRYAVGQLNPGMQIAESEQFDCLDAAFDHWYDTLPASFTLNRAAA